MIWTLVILHTALGAGALLLAAATRPRHCSDFLLRTAVIGFSAIVLGLEILSAGGWLPRSGAAGVSAVVFAAGIGGCWLRPCTGLVCRLPLASSLEAATWLPAWSGIVIVSGAAWAALHYGLQGLLWPVYPVSDAPIYHLPFAIKWWKTGALGLVPAPFGEEAATYFPANGELWLTWLLVTGCSENVVRVGQWPFLLLGSGALYAIARRSGASRIASSAPAVCWAGLPLSLTQSAVANVDLVFSAYYLTAFYFFTTFVGRLLNKQPAGMDALFLGLSSGIALGSKSIGLVFLPVFLAPALLALMSTAIGRGETLRWLQLNPLSTGDALNADAGAGPRRRFWHAGGYLGLFVAGILLPSAFWYARNWLLTGNPLYPLKVQLLGHTVWEGWYTRAEMLNTNFHMVPDRGGLLLARLLMAAGFVLLPLWVLGVLGTLGLVRPGRSSPEAGVAWWSVLVAIISVALYWLVIPYNTQERFLLSALGLGFVPWARVLGRHDWRLAAFAGAYLVHLLLIPMAGALKPLLQPHVTGSNIGSILILAACLALAAAAALRRSAASMAAALVLAVLGCYLYWIPARQLAEVNPQLRFYPRGGFAERMFGAWTQIDDLSGPNGSHVAYAGTNLPYYLYAPGLRNEVSYIAVNAHSEWLPHDYHAERLKRGETVHCDDPWPQWYRREADYQQWLANLRSAKIDLLFVARENTHGRRSGSGGPPAFPIEKQWADAHPEVFRAVRSAKVLGANEEWACVYVLSQAP